MGSEIILSLCIPTNGVLEWVVPVLDSIYEEKNPAGNFEVIITDNGNNPNFEKTIIEYALKHENLLYRKTDAIMFLNQIEAFKMARGQLIKFINHRMKLLPGALNYLIEYAKNNVDTQPVTYFLNGILKLPNENNRCRNFDKFVHTLSYWSSWSAGTTMWKKDFEKMDLHQSFNKLFPHINMIFSEKQANLYDVNNKKILEEIPADITRKGNYDLFNAFAVEYVKVIQELFNRGYISVGTFEYVKNQNCGFVASLYFDYVIRKQPCSYDLSGYKKAINIYYSEKMINREIPKLYLHFMCQKIKNAIFR